MIFYEKFSIITEIIESLLQLYSDSLVKLSDECPNAVTHTSSVSKVEISVMWHAPSPGQGCVVFK